MKRADDVPWFDGMPGLPNPTEMLFFALLVISELCRTVALVRLGLAFLL